MTSSAAKRFALRPGTAVAMLVVVALAAGAALWYYVSRPLPGSVKLVELSEEATATVGFAGMFPAAEDDPIANPLGIAFDGTTLFVAESDRSRILLFDASGARLGEIDLSSEEATVQVYPSALALTGDGRLAIVDNSRSRVLVVDAVAAAEPEILLKLAGTAKRPMAPTAVACDDGEIFVFDAATQTVRVFDSGGDLDRTLGADLQPRLAIVSGMTVADGVLYIADSVGGRVLAIDAGTGTQKAVFPVRYALPRSIRPGHADGLAVVDTFARAVFLVDNAGEQTDVIDAGTVPDGLMESPRDAVWVSETGRLYVTDAGLGRVMVFNVRASE